MESQTNTKRSWFKRHPILTGIGSLILLFIIIGSLGSDDTSSTQQTTASFSSEEQVEETVVAMKVNSETLRKAYSTNQVSADQMYEGKLLEISGTVDTIGKDILDEAYITFEANDPYAFDKVQCMFRINNEGALATLSKGQPITVQGTMSGVMITGPIVRNCKVISN